MTNDDRRNRPLSASRRLFLQRTSLLTGMIALGGGSYLYNPKGVWAAAPIKVGIATDLTGAISWGGIPNSQVAKRRTAGRHAHRHPGRGQDRGRQAATGIGAV